MSNEANPHESIILLLGEVSSIMSCRYITCCIKQEFNDSHQPKIGIGIMFSQYCDVIPRCSYSQRSSQQQETAPMHFSLWQSAENQTKQFSLPISSLILISLVKRALIMFTKKKKEKAFVTCLSPQRSFSWPPV